MILITLMRMALHMPTKGQAVATKESALIITEKTRRVASMALPIQVPDAHQAMSTSKAVLLATTSKPSRANPWSNASKFATRWKAARVSSYSSKVLLLKLVPPGRKAIAHLRPAITSQAAILSSTS